MKLACCLLCGETFKARFRSNHHRRKNHRGANYWAYNPPRRKMHSFLTEYYAQIAIEQLKRRLVFAAYGGAQ